MIIRAIRENDRQQIAEWITRDADHVAKMTPDFFFAPETIGLCFEDRLGPVFYVRLDPEQNGTVRVHMQFDDAAGMLRTSKTLIRGFELVRDKAIKAGAAQLVFDSVTEGLREFCMVKFGFTAVPGTNDLQLALQDEYGDVNVRGS